MTRQDLLDALSDNEGASIFLNSLYDELDLRGNLIRELLAEKQHFISMVRKMRNYQKMHEHNQGPYSKETYRDNPLEGIKAEIERCSVTFDVDAYVKNYGE